jgi:hypothetical protein
MQRADTYGLRGTTPARRPLTVTAARQQIGPTVEPRKIGLPGPRRIERTAEQSRRTWQPTAPKPTRRGRRVVEGELECSADVRRRAAERADRALERAATSTGRGRRVGRVSFD